MTGITIHALLKRFSPSFYIRVPRTNHEEEKEGTGMRTKVKMYRLARNTTITELAAEVGMPEITLRLIEKASHRLPEEYRQPLAQALGVEVRDICNPGTGA